MDFSFDIFQIYRQYCDITSRVYENAEGSHGQEEDAQKARISRNALAHLFKEVESKVCSGRVSILGEVYKLMSRINLTADYSEFSRFYDFVFFICRENSQKNISVSRAVIAWRLVLAGRFRLLDQWCSFVENNQRHNISEDTWRQVLAFSRIVHENLEGYDPEGAWPVLIDDFAEHMYRITGPCETPNILCDCGDSESLQSDDTLSGLRSFPGSKRKSCCDSETGQESSNGHTNSHGNANSKRSRLSLEWGRNLPNEDDCSEIVKQISSTKSPCAVEGCLSKGFAGLLSGRSCLQFHQDRRVLFS